MPDPVGIISALLHPPLRLLVPVLDEGGPYWAGSWTFDTFTTSGVFSVPAGTHPVHNAFGVLVIPNGAIPIEWGYTIGLDSGDALGDEGWRYEHRLCQVVPLRRLLTGAFVGVDIVDVHYVPQLVMWSWNLADEDRLGLHVSPGLEIDLFYLCLP